MSYSHQDYLNDVTKQWESLTPLELKVQEKSVEISMYEYCADVVTLSEELHIPVNTIKGVVGSLVKKNLINAVRDKRAGMVFHDLFPTNRKGFEVSYGNENLDEDQI